MKLSESFTGPHRPLLMLAAAVALLLLACAWSYGVLASSRQAALEASDDLATCRKLATRIQALRQKPSVAGTRELEPTELSKQIEEAAKGAGIPAERLVRVWPEQARRVGNSPYKEKPTQVLLRGVSVQQTVTMLHALASSDSGLQVKSLRVIAPREGERADGWTVETTVASLIFAPGGDAATRRGDSSDSRPEF